MKILQINTVCGVKSTGRITTDIAAMAEEKGYVCTIAYGREGIPADLAKYGKKFTSFWSNKWHAVISRAFSKTGYGSKRATKKLVQWIEEYNPDVIHLHNLHGAYIHIGVLFDYLKRADKKVVWTLHDCWAFTGYCAHFDYIRCDRWRKGCGNCPHRRTYDTVWVDKSKRNYLRKKQTFLGVKDMTLATPSYWLKGLVEQSFLKEYPVQVVRNGVDLTKFKHLPSDLREKYALQEKKIVLGVATPWSEKKGLTDFYRLAALLKEEYQVVLVGLTDEQIKAAPKNVLALPATSNIEQLAKWYSTADVFVNCTYEDTYPTVNLESQACNCPAITYRTGGSVESVPDRQVVEQGDVEGLAALIQKGEFSLFPKQLLDKNTYYQQYLRLYAGEKEK